jgi:predicted metal-dependent phosphotriesterase family hydrolase
MSITNPITQPHLVNTVLGPLSHLVFGITDAHNHVWIDPIDGSAKGSPVLNDKDMITRELGEYIKAGGRTILDCQPGGCGRDANMLMDLSITSGVNIITCTGFHRCKYYPQNHSYLKWSEQKWTDNLISELEEGVVESKQNLKFIKAGFIKIALESVWEETPHSALNGAINAARETGAAVEIHTEKGILAENIVEYFLNKGVNSSQIVLCHMDKRMDIGLHTELAKAGVLLEYDTFFRTKYSPEENVWRLIDTMVDSGLSYRLALATDMAEAEYYHNLGSGPGLVSLPGIIRERLTRMHIPENNIQQMLGENIARRLAGLN